MKNFLMAATSGALAGIIVTTQVAGPLLAQEEASKASVYEQLDLFGDIFERIDRSTWLVYTWARRFCSSKQTMVNRSTKRSDGRHWHKKILT